MSKKMDNKIKELAAKIWERAQRGESSVVNPFAMEIEEDKSSKKS